MVIVVAFNLLLLSIWPMFNVLIPTQSCDLILGPKKALLCHIRKLDTLTLMQLFSTKMRGRTKNQLELTVRVCSSQPTSNFIFLHVVVILWGIFCSRVSDFENDIVLGQP